jgi:hypothetical protein
MAGFGNEGFPRCVGSLFSSGVKRIVAVRGMTGI